MAKLENLSGISDPQLKRLAKAGVDDPFELLKIASTPKGRDELSNKVKIAHGRLLDWAQRIDLWRIKGVGDDYARVLAAAGVTGIVDMSTRNPAELSEEVKIMSRGIVPRLPSRRMITKWIEEARHLVRRVWYHEPWGDPGLTGQPVRKFPESPIVRGAESE